MIDGILEIAMLLCFAAAWPVNIIRSWRARTAKGASVLFMIILEVGYLFGMANKVANDDVSYVLFFYVFNFALVLVNIAIVMRNRALDAQRRGDRHRRHAMATMLPRHPVIARVEVRLAGLPSLQSDPVLRTRRRRSPAEEEAGPGP